MNLPNKLTISRIILIPFMLFFMLPIPFEMFTKWNEFVSSYGMIVALLIFSIAAYTDHLDGAIARKNNLVTNLGKFLDPIADKLLILSAFTAFVELNRITAWVPIIILFREFAVTGIRLLGIEQGKVIPSAYLGKLKMVFQIVALIALMLENIINTFFTMPSLNNAIQVICNILVLVAIFFTILSGLDYTIKNKDLLKG